MKIFCNEWSLISWIWEIILSNLLVFFLGWQALFWASTIPVIVRTLLQLFLYISRGKSIFWPLNWLQIILAVGTELQSVLTKMALEIAERHAVVQGMPLVQGSDKYFWFGRPHLVLYLIHFALFQVLYGLLFLRYLIYLCLYNGVVIELYI